MHGRPSLSRKDSKRQVRRALATGRSCRPEHAQSLLPGKFQQPLRYPVHHDGYTNKSYRGDAVPCGERLARGTSNILIKESRYLKALNLPVPEFRTLFQLTQDWVSSMFCVLMSFLGGVDFPYLFLDSEHPGVITFSINKSPHQKSIDQFYRCLE